MDVVFVKYGKHGGMGIHRGDKSVKHLNIAFGDSVSCVSPEEARDMEHKDKIFILIFEYDVTLAKMIRTSGGYVVWDSLDSTKVRKYLGDDSFNAFLLPSNAAVLACVDGIPKMGCVHFWTFDDIPDVPDDRPFGVVYCGGPSEKPLANNRPGVVLSLWGHPLFSDEKQRLKYLDKAVSFPFHISLRNNIFKPQSKITIAARCGSCIITNKEDGPADEILGDKDYPYLCDKPGDGPKMIQYAKETYLKEPWFKGLEIMEQVKKETSDKVIVKQYMDFFDEVRRC